MDVCPSGYSETTELSVKYNFNKLCKSCKEQGFEEYNDNSNIKCLSSCLKNYIKYEKKCYSCASKKIIIDNKLPQCVLNCPEKYMEIRKYYHGYEM